MKGQPALIRRRSIAAAAGLRTRYPPAHFVGPLGQTRLGCNRSGTAMSATGRAWLQLVRSLGDSGATAPLSRQRRSGVAAPRPTGVGTSTAGTVVGVQLCGLTPGVGVRTDWSYLGRASNWWLVSGIGARTAGCCVVSEIALKAPTILPSAFQRAQREMKPAGIRAC